MHYLLLHFTHLHLSCVLIAGSDAGLSQQSEERSLEDTFSLRSHIVGGHGGGGGGSVTSSMWAELGAQVCVCARVYMCVCQNRCSNKRRWECDQQHVGGAGGSGVCVCDIWLLSHKEKGSQTCFACAKSSSTITPTYVLAFVHRSTRPPALTT